MKKLLYLAFLVAVIWAGFWFGRATGGDVVVDAQRDTRTEFPMPPPPPEDEELADFSGDIENDKAVIVELPIDGAEVDGGLTVSGRADADIANVLVTLKDGGGGLLLDKETSVTGGSGEVYGRFSTTLDLSPYEPGALEIVIMGITTGGIGDTVTRRVELVRKDAIAAKVFFANSGLSEDEEEDICTNVHPVERTVSSRSNIYRSVLERLADGPSREEREEGYTTSLPDDVVLRSVAADAEGVVTADFTSSLDRRVGGSCRVSAIRTQIERTLRQFPEVRDVVIRVDGDADTALQP